MNDAAPAPDKNRLVLLANASMRARRRPVMIALAWGYEALLAAAITWPLASFVGGAYRGHPQGDGPLWRAGGLALSDLLFRSQAVLPAISSHVTMLGLLGVTLGLLPLAALIVSIAYTTPERRAPPFRAVAARALAAFPRMLALLLLMTLVEAFVFIGGLLLAGAVASSATPGMGDARAQQLGAVVALLFVLFAMVVGILHDLARTAVIRFDVGALRAMRLGWNALRRGLRNAVWSWAWRTCVGWLPVAMAAMVGARLGGRSGAALYALAALHQLVIVSRVALRASWLAKALRLVDDAHRVVRAPDPDPE